MLCQIICVIIYPLMLWYHINCHAPDPRLWIEGHGNRRILMKNSLHKHARHLITISMHHSGINSNNYYSTVIQVIKSNVLHPIKFLLKKIKIIDLSSMKLTMLNLASKSSVPIFLPTFEINYLNLKNRKKGNELDSPVSNKYLNQIFQILYNF